eukprot:PhM_4_TR6515/c0_g1_i1/m.92772
MIEFPEKFYLAQDYFDNRYADESLGGSAVDDKPFEDAEKLAMYALGRQAADGACTEPAPSRWYLTDYYKHQAWTQLGTMSTMEAMAFYTMKLDEKARGWSERALKIKDNKKNMEKKHAQEDAETLEHHENVSSGSDDDGDADDAMDDETLPSDVESLQTLVKELRASISSLKKDLRRERRERKSALRSLEVDKHQHPQEVDTAHVLRIQVVENAPRGGTGVRSDGVYYRETSRVGWLQWLGLTSGPDHATQRL